VSCLLKKVAPDLGEERYLYSAEKKEDEEFSRLRLQAGIWDPSTIRHLETIGVTDGWRCLEVGAGTGSIAQSQSDREGSSRYVAATDIDTRLLQRIGAPNMEVRQHNVLNDSLELGHYDLAHCRKLLQHLHDPERALNRMADALRPGGWLVIEEDDWGSGLSLDVTDPSLTPVITAIRALLDSLRNRGIADLYFGRRVRGLIEGLGFTDVGQEGTTFMTLGGDSLNRVHIASWPAMVAAGLMTQEEYDGLVPLYADPAFMYPAETVFSAWGRKPAGERRD
jgi:SAM-dependent methyltransferase